MSGRNSMRAIALFMDERAPARSLRELYGKHQALGRRTKPSARDLVSRHTAGARREVSFLFYNAWLLKGVLGFGDKPLLGTRGSLIGQALKNSGYDITALCEVFEEASQQQLALVSELRHHVGGSAPFGPKKGSGLMTLSKYRFSQSRHHKYDESGSGADWWADKGVLLTTIDLGIGKIDLYSTHLSYGKRSKPMREKTMERLRQLQELRAFITATHNPRHVVIVAGDMNINADPNNPDGDGYRRMRRLFNNIPNSNGKTISLVDLWPVTGGRAGGTNQSYHKCLFDHRLTESGAVYCDDDYSPQTKDEGRIDYIFVQKPARSHDIKIDFTRMKRRPFPVPELTTRQAIKYLPELATKEDLERLPPMTDDELAALVKHLIRKACSQHPDDTKGHLSDHLGLEVTLLVSRK